jgi:hypothetical protein
MPRGRPRRHTQSASVRLEMLVTPDEREELKTLAKQHGLSMSGLLREALEVVAEYRDRTVFGGGRGNFLRCP